jgi:transposase-like protein
MAEGARNEEPFEVECPHCHRTFQAELLGPRSPRQAGFKCPHCRLFVSYDRVAGETPPAG